MLKMEKLSLAPQLLALIRKMAISELYKRKKRQRPLFSIFNILSRGGRIRTYDLLLPKQARYRATLHPEMVSVFTGQF
jgi:hypothetical protein